MIISNPQFDDKALYKMDLTRGKIVEVGGVQRCASQVVCANIKVCPID